MAEPKPIASLSSGLLARKGAARPAMRRQGLDALGALGGGMMAHPHPDGEFSGQDDLGWNDMGYDVDPEHDGQAPDYGNLLAGAIPDALPASDTGHAADQAEPAPVVPDVVRQQAEIAERMAEPVCEPAPAVAEPLSQAAPAAPRRKAGAVDTGALTGIAAAPAGRRAAFTLRLDSERHLKLRLASAVTGQSAQQLVTAALDDLLTKIPEIEDLAGRVPRSAGRQV